MRTITRVFIATFAAITLFTSCSAPKHYYAYGDSYHHDKGYSHFRYY
jgi:hypothetical protein